MIYAINRCKWHTPLFGFSILIDTFNCDSVYCTFCCIKISVPEIQFLVYLQKSVHHRSNQLKQRTNDIDSTIIALFNFT